MPGSSDMDLRKPSDEELVSGGLMRVPDAGEFSGLSRSMLYELMDTGELVYVKLGRARRIPRKALVALAARNLRGGWKEGAR